MLENLIVENSMLVQLIYWFRVRLAYEPTKS